MPEDGLELRGYEEASLTADLAIPLTVLRPAPVACSTCRRAKMKCVVPTGEKQCNRCSKRGADCIFEAHKRGQWRRDGLAQR